MYIKVGYKWVFISRTCFAKSNQRFNGPVNAHLRSEIYTNKTGLTIKVIHMYLAPGQSQNTTWG